MKWLLRGLSSSVGTKQVMALTGVGLLGFVLVHMLGNLQVFLGQEAYNAYAAKLKSLGGLLWVARGGLLALFVAHIACAIKLTLRNKAARPVPYAVSEPLASTMASRSMVLSGLVILAFVVYHLLHFTLGVTDPEAFQLTDVLGRHDVYSMFVLGFQKAPVAIAYVIAMLCLGLHLAHGIQSLFQTLGWNGPRYRPLTKAIGLGLTGLIVAGNVAMPLAVLFGVIRLPGAGA
ncbi:MAG: succinate dehydrogenase cytochrome b subunit [Planctomycetota bacterium]